MSCTGDGAPQKNVQPHGPEWLRPESERVKVKRNQSTHVIIKLVPYLVWLWSLSTIEISSRSSLVPQMENEAHTDGSDRPSVTQLRFSTRHHSAQAKHLHQRVKVTAQERLLPNQEEKRSLSRPGWRSSSRGSEATFPHPNPIQVGFGFTSVLLLKLLS